jgi:hypothetical protein
VTGLQRAVGGEMQRFNLQLGLFAAGNSESDEELGAEVAPGAAPPLLAAICSRITIHLT